ncbi:MAG: hypothetical protein L6W00_08680 [Lentisphaeria bacterium]|nr:MAG: hypothetical protein L6W00_08680 [Lentisphaeria bacterium]
MRLLSERRALAGSYPPGFREREVAPEEIVEAALRHGCRSVAFTYNEPTVFLEYALAVARLAKEANLATVLVSNGWINPEPMRELYPLIDAANIDMKGFSESFYRELCGGTPCAGAPVDGVLPPGARTPSGDHQSGDSGPERFPGDDRRLSRLGGGRSSIGRYRSTSPPSIRRTGCSIGRRRRSCCGRSATTPVTGGSPGSGSETFRIRRPESARDLERTAPALPSARRDRKAAEGFEREELLRMLPEHRPVHGGGALEHDAVAERRKVSGGDAGAGAGGFRTFPAAAMLSRALPGNWNQLSLNPGAISKKGWA